MGAQAYMPQTHVLCMLCACSCVKAGVVPVAVYPPVRNAG